MINIILVDYLRKQFSVLSVILNLLEICVKLAIYTYVSVIIYRCLHWSAVKCQKVQVKYKLYTKAPKPN